ncbi:MFS transporter [Arthrobacter sp. 35W]|uniref:MFS transporter n=1 Tax=Arthrobacter sp. 35W TaxID=1132441 RepID=UPI003FA4A4D4
MSTTAQTGTALDPEAGAAAVEPQAFTGHAPGSTGYRRIMAALACAGVATFAQLYSLQGVLPLVAKDLDATASQASLAVSAATLGLALAVLPWSFAADRMGRVRTMTVAIILATLAALAVPASPSFEVLIALRFVEGAALGGVPAVAIAYLGEEVAARQAGAAAGVYVAGTTLGGLFGRLLAGPVADAAGWRAAALSVSIAAAIAGTAFVLLAPPPRGFPQRGLRRHGPAEPGAGLGAAAARLLPQLRNKRLLALYVQAFALMGAFVSVYNYLGFRLQAPPYLLPATAVALLFLAYLAGTVSSRVAGAWAERAGRRTVLLGSTVLMTAGLVVTLGQHLLVVLLGLVLFTAGFFGAHAVASGWTGAMAVGGRAQAASLYNLSYYAGSSLVGWAVGLLFQHFGWSALVAVLAALLLLAAGTAVVLLPARQPLQSRQGGTASS